MRKLFLILLAIIPLFIWSDNSLVKCDPELQHYFNSIMKVPEAQQLLSNIQKEGPIKIRVNRTQLSDTFGAYWDPFNREICVSYTRHSSNAAVIGSIIFELHNAAATSQFAHYDYLASSGQIGKSKYVESMEHIEYVNSLNAAQIAEKGIKMGVLPRGARLPTFRNFQEHYSVQQSSGHSAYFARCYDLLMQENRQW